jgi:multimeric flavodoxin WrbA
MVATSVVELFFFSSVNKTSIIVKEATERADKQTGETMMMMIAEKKSCFVCYTH